MSDYHTSTPTPMPTQNPHIPLFDQLRNTVEVAPEKNGLRFWWSRKGIGFGCLTIGLDKDEKFVVDTECMSPEICGEIVAQAITEALARQKSEEGKS